MKASATLRVVAFQNSSTACNVSFPSYCVVLPLDQPTLIKQSNATQLIAANTTTTVVFGSTPYNGQNAISYSGTTFAYTNAAGATVTLLVSYTITWSATTTTTTNQRVFIETGANCTPASARLGETMGGAAIGSNDTVVSGSAVVTMSAGATFTIKAWNNNTGGVNILSPSYCSVVVL